MQFTLAQPYPENVFLPKLEDALRRVQRAVQAPFPMVASSAIGAISLACQKGYQIERKPGIVYPVSLALVTCAVPSERKSTVDRCFIKPMKDFEKTLETQYLVSLKKWTTQDDVYKSKREGYKRAIIKLASHGEDTLPFEQKLAELQLEAGEKPKKTVLILNDASKEGILNFLNNYGNSCGVMVDDGAVFFESSSAKHVGLFVKLLSGDETRLDKSDGKGFTLRNPRMTMSIMVQPEIFYDFIKKKGKLWRASGLLSRFLVSYPISNIGSR